MSEVSYKIKTSLSVEDTIKAIRRCAKSFGSLIEKKNGVFQVKDNVQRTLLSTSWPATVDIYVSDYNGNTIIMLYSHNFGIGTKECESKLGFVKNTIEEELEKIEKEISELHDDKLDSINKNLDVLIKLKQLLDMGAISQEEFDTKKKELL